MSRLQVQVEGFSELENKIKLLASDKDKRKEVLMILRQVAKPTLRAAKATAPTAKKPHTIGGKTRSKKVIQPGNLRKSIGEIVGKRGQSKENPTLYIGPRAKGNFDGFYGAWVHEGHNLYRAGYKRKRTASGTATNNANATRKTRSNPFMKRAANQTQSSVASDAEKKMAKFIQRRIDKLSS